MGIIRKIIDGFIPALTPEQTLELRREMEQFQTIVDEAKGHYITKKEAGDLRKTWDVSFRKIKGTHLRQDEEVYPAVHSFLERYRKFPDRIPNLNEQFYEEESKRCEALLGNIDGKSLDPQQRRVVLCEEPRCLVLAGAGSGKTLTISGKVKYLVDVKKVAPEDILLISFTRKAAEEMTERIAKKLGISVQATTFHKLGLDIISQSSGRKPEVQDQLDAFVRDYFETQIIKDPKQLKVLLEFFACYLEIPADLLIEKPDSLGELYEMEKSADYETLRGKYEQNRYMDAVSEERRGIRKTMRNEQVKSLQEVEIANFLFLNGIEYEYEPLYPFETADENHRDYHPDFFLPDYGIYIEHFGVNRNGNLPWLSPVEEAKYKEGMTWKRQTHAEHGTILLETTSAMASEGVLLERLEQMLKNQGVQFHTPDFAEIFETVYTKESEKYFSEFMKLCVTFINLFKSNGYKVEDLVSLQGKNKHYLKPFFRKRTELFKEIVGPIMAAYNQSLQEQGSVDFSDMINTATSLVEGGFQVHPYRYVIVDEYQDISVARYKLIAAILKQTNANLLCVGDDWQSIYRFAGSDISLFTGFERYFGEAEILRLEKTYRNSQQLINEAGKFVMANRLQFKKDLRSPKTLNYPITFLCYEDHPFGRLKQALDKILTTQGKEASILILGRTNFDFDTLAKSGLFTIQAHQKIRYKASPDTPIEFMTVHRSKGLEADNVILLFQGGKLGFPNKIADDPLLELVLTEEEDFLYAEERRLLYVALTRTRNRVYLIANEARPSEFQKEFHSSDSVFILSSKKEERNPVACPRCKTGHLVLRQPEGRRKAFVSCSNFPRCDFSMNDTSVLTDPVICPDCGGFLIRRRGKYGTFLGCSNYPICEHTEEQ